MMVRQPQSYGNSGDWVNGMAFTMTLGCGTWGGNITTENITWKHFLNVTWVSYPVPGQDPRSRSALCPAFQEIREVRSTVDQLGRPPGRLFISYFSLSQKDILRERVKGEGVCLRIVSEIAREGEKVRQKFGRLVPIAGC